MLPQNEHQNPFLAKASNTIIIKQCAKCQSKRFNIIDNNNWFHCWECRLVCNVKDLEKHKQ